MANKWQQWMPFYIDRFMGSRSVGSMSHAAKMGYLYLLAAQWQSDDCSVPSEDEDLAIESGLGDQWLDHKATILRKFERREDGRLFNPVAAQEWEAAKAVYEKRWGAATRTNAAKRDACSTVTARSPRAKRHGASTVTARSIDGHRDTGTGTGTETKEEKPSAAAASGEPSRHVECRTAIHGYWQAFHEGEASAPWDGSDAKKLSGLLAANPRLTSAGFRKLLDHRARSEVNHSQRPREWLERLTDYAGGPLDKFGKPMGGGDGRVSANRAQDRLNGVVKSHAAALARIRGEGGPSAGGAGSSEGPEPVRRGGIADVGNGHRPGDDPTGATRTHPGAVPQGAEVLPPAGRGV